MKLLLAVCIGFAVSVVTAVFIGFFIGMAFPFVDDTPSFYAAEFAGIVISLTVWYFFARRLYRYFKSKDSQYAERLA